MASPDSIYREYVSSIPASNRYKLQKQLDFEHGGLEKHLGVIADSMINWREKLATALELNPVNVDIIVKNNQNNITHPLLNHHEYHYLGSHFFVANTIGHLLGVGLIG